MDDQHTHYQTKLIKMNAKKERNLLKRHTTLLLHPFCENISANSSFNSLSFKIRLRLFIELFI
jgi:hypothetical protein